MQPRITFWSYLKHYAEIIRPACSFMVLHTTCWQPRDMWLVPILVWCIPSMVWGLQRQPLFRVARRHLRAIDTYLRRASIAKMYTNHIITIFMSPVRVSPGVTARHVLPTTIRVFIGTSKVCNCRCIVKTLALFWRSGSRMRVHALRARRATQREGLRRIFPWRTLQTWSSPCKIAARWTFCPTERRLEHVDSVCLQYQTWE